MMNLEKNTVDAINIIPGVETNQSTEEKEAKETKEEKQNDNVMENLITDTSLTPEQKIDGLCELYLHFESEAISVQSTSADLAIFRGEILNALRSLVKEIRINGKRPKWEAWVTARFPMVKESTRNKSIRLALCPDIHEFSYLGIERLIKLLRGQVSKKSCFPMRSILIEKGIGLDERDYLPCEVVREVDALLDGRRATNQTNVVHNFNKNIKRAVKCLQKTKADTSINLQELDLGELSQLAQETESFLQVLQEQVAN